MDQEIVAVDNMEELFELATDDELSASLNYELKPEYRVLKIGRELNEMNVTLKKAGYYPSLSGYASFQGVAQGDDLLNDPIWSSNSFLGLSLKVPIFDGLEKKAKVNRARLDLANVINRQIELERAITMEVQNARTNYLSAIERWKNQKKNVELAERIYETTQIKYREGVGSSIEITQAEYSLFDSQSNYIRSRYDLLVAKMALDKDSYLADSPFLSFRSGERQNKYSSLHVSVSGRHDY
jgi:outer membrane protein TolC